MEFNLSEVASGLLSWVFVILALYILVRSIVSLLKSKNPAEVWAYVSITKYKDVDGYAVEDSQFSVPLTHWENVIGRARSCDIQVTDEAMSRNHGLLLRSDNGTWQYQDLGSKNGSYLCEKEDIYKADETGEPVEFVKISKPKVMGPKVRLEYGDTIRVGMTELSLIPMSIEERNNNRNMRKSDTRVMSEGPTMAALTLFQILTITELWMNLGTDYLGQIITSIGGLMALMWLYVGLLKTNGKTGFEMETIAFFLSTLSLAVIASSAPSRMTIQLVAIAIGVGCMYVICLLLRNLEIAKKMRIVMVALGVGVLIANLVFGTITNGAKNWIEIFGMTFQPSELVKVAFIWIGAGTIDELFRRKQLYLFLGFSLFCLACLGMMGDFGTALIFFATYLIISFLRSGDISRLALVLGVAGAGGLMILKFKPYVLQRFQTWGHVWDADVYNNAGFQQTRCMSAAASGGLIGVGAGDGWLAHITAANTDMVFGMLIEEWGLIIALLAVLSICTLAFFAIRSIMSGRSTFYTIAACGAMSMFSVQTMLNVFGCVDILPFTGVTFPFVSAGGTSMIVSWSLLAFLKSADTREKASLAVKGGAKI